MGNYRVPAAILNTQWCICIAFVVMEEEEVVEESRRREVHKGRFWLAEASGVKLTFIHEEGPSLKQALKAGKASGLHVRSSQEHQ